MIKKQPTIKDVALRSGVSIATVDRVLHNRGKVSQKNLKAVTEAIEHLSFQPNQIARALSVRKNNLKIGVTYPKVENEFWAEIDLGITSAKNLLRPFGVELIIDHTNRYNRNDQLKSIDNLIKQNVNGIIFTPVSDSLADMLDQHIPENVHFVTVIEDIVGSRRLFHIGPDDFQIGALAAKLIYLYTEKNSKVIILSPNARFTGTQKRISGFMSKIKQEQLNIDILQICNVPSETEEESYQAIYQITLDCIRNHSSLNAIYVTNGLTQWCADAVKDSGKSGKVSVFGHEFTSGIGEFLESGTVAATIYQKPAQQFYTAICMLYEFLIGDRTIAESNIVTECSILIKESLPFIKIGGMDLL